MKYYSVSEFAKERNLSERTVRNYCATGKIAGAFLTGKTWNIPEDAVISRRGQMKKSSENPLLTILKEQKEMKLKGGIYHRIQVDLTYNSNHMEGSRLTQDQTRYIFETNTIGITEEAVNVDDIIETTNHFKCIDLIIDKAHTKKLSEAFIKDLHCILKSGTSDSRKDWFSVGDYKKLPNEVGGSPTCSPENVAKEMKELLGDYNATSNKSIETIIAFHRNFECIHPFQDGNGRVGRLIMFKECLSNNIVPFIIDEELKWFYYRGLQEWDRSHNYLVDICLAAQDKFKLILDYFRIGYQE